MQRMKIGFLGGGVNSAIGYTHFLASRLDGLLDVAAGCFSRDLRINHATAEKLGVIPTRCYRCLDEMLEAEAGRLDAICILTPTPDHAVSVVAALRSGFHVICEKALTTSPKDVDLIKIAVAESGRNLMVCFNYVGYPMVREARAKIAAGHLGQVHQIQCEMPQESFVRQHANPQSWRREDYEIPCVSLDLGVHVHHMVYYLSGGAESSGSYAVETCNGKISDVVDTVNVLATYDKNFVASMTWGKAFLGNANGLKFQVYGERGSLWWKQSEPEVLGYANEGGSKVLIERGQPDLLEANKPEYNRFKAGHPAGFIEAFANIYRDFHSIISGASPCDGVYDVESALAGLEFLSSAHQVSEKVNSDHRR